MLKKMILSGAIVIITAICGIGYDIQKQDVGNKNISQKTVEKGTVKNKKSTENVEKEKTEENISTEDVEETKKVEEKQENNSTNDTKQTEAKKSNTTTYQVPQQNQQETKTTQTQPANTQPQQPAQPPRPQTEWEKLGISEYAYYNTPMFSWEEKAYSNINDCINEANSINQKYGFVTNYGYVSGKYVDTIGCWVKVYVDGNKYYLGAFRALGY